jgi:hypothetical protein
MIIALRGGKIPLGKTKDHEEERAGAGGRMTTNFDDLWHTIPPFH